MGVEKPTPNVLDVRGFLLGSSQGEAADNDIRSP